MTGITPIHIDDTVSSLSAILLNDDYYKVLLEGKVNVKGLSVLRPECLILFKAKAYRTATFSFSKVPAGDKTSGRFNVFVMFSPICNIKV